MRRSVLCLALLLACGDLLSAQVRKFPYDATITQDETYVRSGPGTRYYPTSRLNSGSKVTVYRHDPGGWYMIAPPPGSFSWIRAEYVQTGDGRTGSVTENHVVVRVGTEFGDTRDVEQQRLSKGDRVDILGEKTFATEQGSIRMYKILPPRGEYRWVPGQSLAPLDAVAKEDHNRDPYKIPTDAKPINATPRVEPDPFAEKPAAPNAAATTVKPGDAVARSERPQASAAETARLNELDNEFRRIVRTPTAQWDFVALGEGYRALRNAASTTALEEQLDQRFAALNKYQRIKDQYDEFVNLTRDTAARDAQLLSNGVAPQVVAPTAPTQVPATSPGTITSRPMTPAQPRSTAPTQPASPPPRLDGAGIIQRSAIGAPGMPRHVLLAGNGRILAYLQSTGGLNLDQFVGREMGVIGTRTYRTDLKSDFIEVEALTPVRLRP